MDEKMYATNMNTKLLKAHLDNDAAVLRAYGFDVSWAKDIENHETDIALELMRRSVRIADASKKTLKRKRVLKQRNHHFNIYYRTKSQNSTKINIYG